MSIQYLVYDIESIVDKSLLNRVLFAGQELSDEDAYTKHLEAIRKDDGSTFVNASFHIPVCLACLALEKDYSIQKIGLLGGDDNRTPGSITKHFWDMYNRGNFVLVDFNGRGYDIRLMELWAFRQGIPIHYRHFDKFGVRYRYSDDKHLDLQEAITNNLSIRYQGGLNLLAKLLNKPGKMDTKGDMVQDLYEQNKLFEIEDYCLGDVMDTYFVFLRWKVVRGNISLEQEKELVDQAVSKMQEFSKDKGYFKKYLEVCRHWEPAA